MEYPFSKYSGCGNDFILFDNRSNQFPDPSPFLISRLCHRQNGIGADGVILLESSKVCHLKMRIFNSDGTEAEMCGNGIRCLAKFMKEKGIQGHQFTIETMCRNLTVSTENENVAVEMGDPKELRWNIPIETFYAHHLDTGVPHAVIFCSDVNAIEIQKWGPSIRHHPLFAPRGANANFAHLDKSGTIHLRTFERGVENETLACGTGATATALAAAQMHQLSSPIQVQVKSGEVLTIDFKKSENGFKNIRMIGPANFIFSGSINLNIE